MPYTKIIHYCKKCGTPYKCYRGAYLCEKGHLEPLFVGQPLYSETDRKNNYPMRVTVEYQCDGKMIEENYYRHLSNRGFYSFTESGELYPMSATKPVYNERGYQSDLPLSVLVTLDNGDKVRYYRKLEEKLCKDKKAITKNSQKNNKSMCCEQQCR